MEDQRIADLYAELAFPSASRLQAALRKEGITVPLSRIKNIVSSTGSRQVLQAPPSYAGNITAGRIDDRWAADLLSFVSKPADRPLKMYRHVLLVQDIFSRFIWAVPLSTTSETRAAFETILDQGRKPRELNTDKGSDFTSRAFETMLARRGIQHRLKVGLNDLATVDRAMGIIKDMLARRIAELGGDWLDHIEAVIAAYNKLDHGALHEHAPGEVQDDDELRFQLRMENANQRYENVQRANVRADKLENKGGFRTLLQPLALKRRKGVPNWSSQVHTVQTVSGGIVEDTDGNVYDTRLVLPVNALSSVPAQVATGGSKPRDDRRRVLSREFLQPLREIVARAGSISISQASKAMMQKQRFKQTLSELRMSFQQFARLWPDFAIKGSGKDMRLSLTAPIPRRTTGTLDDFAQ